MNALALLATIVLTVRNRTLPRWLSWCGVPVAAGLVAASVTGAFNLALPYALWIPAAGVVLLREDRQPARALRAGLAPRR